MLRFANISKSVPFRPLQMLSGRDVKESLMLNVWCTLRPAHAAFLNTILFILRYSCTGNPMFKSPPLDLCHIYVVFHDLSTGGGEWFSNVCTIQQYIQIY